MTDRAKKISELTVATSATGNNLLVVVQNVSGSYATRSITATNFLNSFNVKSIKIANSSTTYTANVQVDEIIFANANQVGNNITITLPTTAPIGKIFTVKSINPIGGYNVSVTSSLPEQNKIETIQIQ